MLLLGRTHHDLAARPRHDVHRLAVHPRAQDPGRPVGPPQPDRLSPDRSDLRHQASGLGPGRDDHRVAAELGPVREGDSPVEHRCPGTDHPVTQQAQEGLGDQARVDVVILGKQGRAGDPRQGGLVRACLSPVELLEGDALGREDLERASHLLQVVVVLPHQQRARGAQVDVHAGGSLQSSRVLRPQSRRGDAEPEQVGLTVPGLTGRGEHPGRRPGGAAARVGIEHPHVVPAAH